MRIAYYFHNHEEVDSFRRRTFRLNSNTGIVQGNIPKQRQVETPAKASQGSEENGNDNATTASERFCCCIGVIAAKYDKKY